MSELSNAGHLLVVAAGRVEGLASALEALGPGSGARARPAPTEIAHWLRQLANGERVDLLVPGSAAFERYMRPLEERLTAERTGHLADYRGDIKNAVDPYEEDR